MPKINQQEDCDCCGRQKRKIFIILPAFNEEENLKLLLERIASAMEEELLSYEVIVVDDGSTDETFKIAQECSKSIQMRVERHGKNMGLGETIRDGLWFVVNDCSDDDIVVVMDADNTHTPGLIVSMVRSIKEGCDVVIASRYQKGSFVRGLVWNRLLLSYIASILFRVVFHIKGVRDYTSGFRAYRGVILKQAFEQYGDSFVSEEGFQCMVDILLKLYKMDVIFREVPLILRYDMKGGASKMNIGRTIWKTLLLMIKRRVGIR